MAEVNIISEKREKTTKSAVNQLRKAGNVPGVLYSNEMEHPINFVTSELALRPVVYTKEMHLVNLKIDDKEYKCILKDTQFDPLTDKLIHVDFQAIKVGQAIQVHVPIKLEGQAIGVRTGGRLQQHLYKLDIECLPKDIPDIFPLDISELEIGGAIHVKDLSLGNINILNNEDNLIVAIIAPKGIDEDEVSEDEEADVEDTAKEEEE
jgi:large subunit ribosomal protein L25